MTDSEFGRHNHTWKIAKRRFVTDPTVADNALSRTLTYRHPTHLKCTRDHDDSPSQFWPVIDSPRLLPVANSASTVGAAQV
ncbi:hypothetical protein I6A84_22925 [Frankia sp. CNm7]|nr:hypothetical protein [Frankia nepalensis]MBL7520862.1 hypothetical protein [Frankia nepalensis]